MEEERSRRMRPPLQVVFLLVFLLKYGVVIGATPVTGGGGGSYAVQPFVFPTTSPSSTVIPAFPEQSDIAGPCPLDLPDDLFSGISRACSGLVDPSSSSSSSSSSGTGTGSSSSGPPPSPTARLRCCPSLAAWLYSAHSSAALQSTRFIPTTPASTADLPVLPDDSESCAETAEKALKGRGVALARANETCGAVYCYCGIRLRPLSCPGGFRVEKVEGTWVAGDDSARRIERECDAGSRVSVEGCSRCLRSLYQLNTTASGNTSSSMIKSDKGGHPGAGAGAGGGDCELMGLTYLLASNRTRYLPVVTRVLRTLMFSPTGSSPPSSCSDTYPLAVGSAVLYDEDLESETSSGTGWSCLHHRHRSFQILLVVLLILLLGRL